MALHPWQTREEMRHRYTRAGHPCPRYPAWLCEHCGKAEGKTGDPMPPNIGCLELGGHAMPP